MTLTIYGDLNSGNCLKVKWTAEKLGLAYDWVAVDVVAGGAKAPAFQRLNPAAQVPTVVLNDGRSLAQSNAIILHLAEGTELIPTDPYQRAKMLEWLFWEQNSHEPTIAVRRRLKFLVGVKDEDIDPSLLAGGERALARMESWLDASPFLVDGKFSLADIALSAYTRMSHQGGFDLSRFPAVQGWIGRVEAELGLEPLTD